MAIKIDLSEYQSIEHDLDRHPELAAQRQSIAALQMQFTTAIAVLLKGIPSQRPLPALHSLRAPERLSASSPEAHDDDATKTEYRWTNEAKKIISVEPQEVRLLEIAAQWQKIVEAVNKKIAAIQQEREPLRQAKDKLFKTLRYLSGRFKVHSDPPPTSEAEFTERLAKTFEELKKDPKMTEERADWEVPILAVWDKYRKSHPDDLKLIAREKEFPDTARLEKTLVMEKTAQDQLSRLLQRLNDKPDMYEDTIKDLLYMLEQELTRLKKAMTELKIDTPDPTISASELSRLLQEGVVVKQAKKKSNGPLEEETPEEVPSGPHRGATIVVTLIAALGLATAYFMDKIQKSPAENIPATATDTDTPASPSPVPSVIPATPNTNANFHTDSPAVQILVDELNSLLQNQRKVSDWYPLLDTRSQSVILFLAGPEGLIPAPEQGGLEGYLKTQPTLRKLDQPVTVRSIVVTDGTRRQDGGEVRFDACMVVDARGKEYYIVYDPKAYSEIPQDRLVSGYKIFEVQEGRNLHLVLEAVGNEHINPQDRHFIGTFNGRTIDAPFVMEREFGNGLDKIAAEFIRLLKNR